MREERSKRKENEIIERIKHKSFYFMQWSFEKQSGFDKICLFFHLY